MARCYNCMREYRDGFDICPHCGYDMTSAADDLYYLPPGTMLSNDRYLVGTAVNTGGFGIVYKAWDKTFDKMIAIKEYYPGGVAARTPGTSEVLVYSDKRVREYEQGKERFLNEARKVARFNTHPNIVDVYDFFEDNHTAYMVMEYMDGMTYKTYIQAQGGKISQQLAVSVTLAVLDALKEVHKEKIIHRDINPSNIFICSNGMVKLFDFGAARIEATDMSSILTPHYAPPEQYSTMGRQGAYTDIYAVGATTYFALTGIKPEESTDRVQEDHLVPLHEVDAEIPTELSNAVMRAMALREELRFQSTDQFKDALLNKRPVLDVEQEIMRRRKRRVIQAAATLSVLLVAGGAFFYNIRKQRDDATLKPADLQVWVVADDNDTPEDAKERFHNVTAAFQEEYRQVSLQVTAMARDEYEKKINEAAEAGTLPDLFDSTYLDPGYSGLLQPLDMTLNLIEEPSRYLFLDEYGQLFPEKKQMPLCFQIPVVYARMDAEGAGQGGFRTYASQSGGSYTYSVKPEDFMLYDSMEGDGCVEGYRQLAKKNGADMMSDSYRLFKEGKVEYYLSDTGDYQMLTEDMPAQFEVEFLDAGTYEVRFDHLWSVSASSDEGKKKASQWMIYYMLSDSAQSVLGVKHLEGVPLSQNMYQVFTEVYQSELSAVQEQIPKITAGGSAWERKNKEYMKKWKDER